MASTQASTYAVYGDTAVIAASGISELLGDFNSGAPLSGPGSITVSGTTNIAFSPIFTDYAFYSRQTPTLISAATNIGNTTFVGPAVVQLTNVGGILVGGAPPLNVVTLDGAGPYIFQVSAGDLVTDPTLGAVSFVLMNGALASEVYWTVTGSANLQTLSGNSTGWIGTLIVQGNIDLGVGVTSAGSLCAPAGTITLNSNMITSTALQQDLDFNTTSEYALLQSSLADDKAVQIRATNTYGGIYMQSGSGGVMCTTTNSINLRATNASCFTVTGTGNLDLRAAQGLINLDANTGINIGRGITGSTAVVNIGTYAPNQGVNLYAGSGATGGINLLGATGASIHLETIGAESHFTLASTADGQDLTIAVSGAYDSSLFLSSGGTGLDALALNASAGGMQLNSLATLALSGTSGVTVNSSGNVLVSSVSTAANAIKLDASSGLTGGVRVNAGSNGIVLDGYNGGVTTGGINLNSGGWNGIGINSFGGGGVGVSADPSSVGELFLGTGNAGYSRPITIGNQTWATALTQRWGSHGGFVQTQYAPAAATTTILAANLLTRLLTITTVAPTTQTLDTATNIIAAINGIVGFLAAKDNDSFDFILMNLGTFTCTVAAGTGGTLIGSADVAPPTSTVSGAGTFRVQINPTGGTYNVFRIG